MKTTRFITLTALYTALLIGVQFALSWVAGVELVTVFFLAFCFCCGIKAGVAVAVCFSTLRCLLFGFFPTVIILYLVYYTGFALFFGFLGNKFHRKADFCAYLWCVILSTAFTAAFTLLDDAITPIFFGFGIKETQAYFYASLPFMLTQCICAAISVGVLFIPLSKALRVISVDDKILSKGDENYGKKRNI